MIYFINLERNTRSKGTAVIQEIPPRTRKPKVSSETVTKESAALNSQQAQTIMATSGASNTSAPSNQEAINQLLAALETRLDEKQAKRDREFEDRLHAKLEQERRELDQQFEHRLEQAASARLQALNIGATENPQPAETARPAEDPQPQPAGQPTMPVVQPHKCEKVYMSMRAQDPNLRKPDTFSAPTQIVSTGSFMTEYEHYIDLAYPGDEGARARYLGTYLNGKARQWYDRIVKSKPQTRTDYQAAKGEFTKHFETDEQFARLQSINKQGKSESVETYAAYLSDIILARGLSEQDAVERLVDGLKPSINRTVALQCPKTFEAAVRLAKIAEASQIPETIDTEGISAILTENCKALADRTDKQFKELTAKVEAISKPTEETVEAFDFHRGYDSRRGSSNKPRYHKGNNISKNKTKQNKKKYIYWIQGHKGTTITSETDYKPKPH